MEPELEEIIKRIERRLEVVGLNPTTAGRQAGHKDVIRNLLRSRAGKKAPRVGLSTSTLKALAPVLGTTASWLMEGVGQEGTPMIPIVGTVGETLDGVIVPRGPGQPEEYVPRLPGFDENGSAVEVKGNVLHGFVDDGSLIYFGSPSDPVDSMLGLQLVVKVEDGPMMVTRLLRGSRPGLYDLEMLSRDKVCDAALEWAALILTRIEPEAARKVPRWKAPQLQGGEG